MSPIQQHRHRLNRGGNRQANAALYRVVIVRMRGHKSTLDYIRRRTEGEFKSEIRRVTQSHKGARPPKAITPADLGFRRR